MMMRMRSGGRRRMRMDYVMKFVIACAVLLGRVSASRDASIRNFAIRTLNASAMESAQYYPKGRQLSPRRLTAKLGENFNSAWMSIEKPYKDGDEPSTIIKNTMDSRLIQSLDGVNFSLSSDATLKPYVQKLMEKWLLDKASCPVRFSWKDIGGLFWPRWIKLGECVAGSPCSWPPGMHCVPAESHTIFVLRWHCRKRKRRGRKLLQPAKDLPKEDEQEKGLALEKKLRNNGRSSSSSSSSRDRSKKRNRGDKRNRDKRNRSRDRNGIHCKWLKVRYPVTSECYCSC